LVEKTSDWRRVVQPIKNLTLTDGCTPRFSSVQITPKGGQHGRRMLTNVDM
jgi:hypothetical protein